MTRYSGTSAYDLSLFEEPEYVDSAPQKQAVPGSEKKSGVRHSTAPAKRRAVKHGLTPVQKAALIASELFKSASVKSVAVVVAAGILIASISTLVFSRVKLEQLKRDITAVEEQIAIENSENTRLNMQLDSFMSIDKVEEYAQNVLGMVKLANYNTEYINFETADKVEVSGGKSVGTGSGLLDKAAGFLSFLKSDKG